MYIYMYIYIYIYIYISRLGRESTGRACGRRRCNAAMLRAMVVAAVARTAVV